jgi:hypothetical protein
LPPHAAWRSATSAASRHRIIRTQLTGSDRWRGPPSERHDAVEPRERARIRWGARGGSPEPVRFPRDLARIRVRVGVHGEPVPNRLRAPSSAVCDQFPSNRRDARRDRGMPSRRRDHR